MDAYHQSKVVLISSRFYIDIALIDNKKTDCFEQNKDIDLDQIPKSKVESKLSYCMLALIFTHMSLTNILINFDHGVIPAAVNQIKLDLGLNNINVGLLGSLVYLGLTLGSILTAPLFTKCNPKIVISIAMLLNGASLIIFPLVGNNFMLL